METESSARYACPCCGCRTFAAPPSGSYIVCPVCVWEDLPPLDLVREGISLHRAQRSFLATGAADPRYRDAARAPEPHEQRPAGWQSIDETIETLTGEIAAAFADVTREDGVTLHEADVLDGYGSDEQRAAARRLDTDRHWSEVEQTAIERHPSAANFLDAKGFRYYLPAYMSWALRNYDTTDSAAIGSLLSTLSTRWEKDSRPGVAPIPDPERCPLLTDAQAQTVCRFLRFFAAYSDSGLDVEHAQQALRQHWAQFCEAN
jgi:hypothetical protein